MLIAIVPQSLARISHRKKLGLGTFTLYEYNPTGGEDFDVYVMDTGINIHHVKFKGRAPGARPSFGMTLTRT